MNGLVFFVGMIAIGLLLTNIIDYGEIRSTHKHNLKRFLARARPIRILTDEENELLQPYLTRKKEVEPLSLQKSLSSNEVFSVSGPIVMCTRTLNGDQTTFYTFDGIEAVFPYQLYLSPNEEGKENIGEVVLTAKYAIVLTLNGTTMKEMKFYQEQQALELQRLQAEAEAQFVPVPSTLFPSQDLLSYTLDKQQKEFETYEPLEDDFDESALEHVSAEATTERDENKKVAEQDNNYSLTKHKATEIECKIIQEPNIGLVSAAALFLSIAQLINYQSVSVERPLLFATILSIILFLVALIAWFKPRPIRAHQIDQLKAPLIGHDTKARCLLFAKQDRAYYPAHWTPFVSVKPQQMLDITRTSSDKQILRLGHQLSLEQEYNQYGAPLQWRKHLPLLAVASALLFYIAISSFDSVDAFRRDIAGTQVHLTGQSQHWRVTEESQLRGLEMKEQDGIEIKAKALCSIEYYPNCLTLIIEQAELINSLALQQTPITLKQYIKQQNEHGIAITIVNPPPKLRALYTLPATDYSHLAAQEAYLQKLSRNEGRLNLRLNGLISAVHRNEKGEIKAIEVDPQWQYDAQLGFAPLRAMKVILPLMLVILISLNTLGLLYKLYYNRRRIKQIQRDYQSRNII